MKTKDNQLIERYQRYWFQKSFKDDIDFPKMMKRFAKEVRKSMFTIEERKAIRGALFYYMEEATQHDDGTVGLKRDSREYKLLDSIKRKLNV